MEQFCTHIEIDLTVECVGADISLSLPDRGPTGYLKLT